MKAGNDSLKNIEWLVRLMDSQFKIPGTNIRFGLDALIGLIPGMGDLSTFIVSAIMLSTFAKNGASSYVLARMSVNILIDALIGAIPILGDIFDVAFRANEKNLKLMKEHSTQGKHQGSALKVVIPLILFLAVIIGCIIWLSYKFISWLIELF
ncbi:MAG: DUF4112 domain-containing protein [Bacteroidota bacterium]